MTKPVSRATLLRRVRKLIKGHWTQGTYKVERSDGTFAYCLVGALREATGDYQHDLQVFLELLIGELSLTGYNDSSSRTEKDILALLNRGIQNPKSTEPAVAYHG